MGLPLSVQALKWSFRPGDAPFLSIPHLELGPGQLVAVTGPSGAGKSTLLFLLAGLEAPTSGTVVWGAHTTSSGRGAQRDRWRRQNLGLVFQDFQLIPELTARENVLLPLTFDRFRVSPADRNRAGELLEVLGVHRLGARASTLSRGEMQRTALARALLGRPPVILADEPTASLDSVSEAAVVELLLGYCRSSGATVIVSTHQAALREAADRHWQLDHGRITEEIR